MVVSMLFKNYHYVPFYYKPIRLVFIFPFTQITQFSDYSVLKMILISALKLANVKDEKARKKKGKKSE